MSKKKRTKKYRPRHVSPMAHLIAISEAKNEALPENYRTRLSLEVYAILSRLKSGLMTQEDYECFVITMYGAAMLAGRLEQYDSSDQIQHMHADFLDTAARMTAIGERFNSRGKFIATGDELIAVGKTADYYHIFLEISPARYVADCLRDAYQAADRMRGGV